MHPINQVRAVFYKNYLLFRTDFKSHILSSLIIPLQYFFICFFLLHLITDWIKYSPQSLTTLEARREGIVGVDFSGVLMERAELAQSLGSSNFYSDVGTWAQCAKLPVVFAIQEVSYINERKLVDLVVSSSWFDEPLANPFLYNLAAKIASTPTPLDISSTRGRIVDIKALYRSIGDPFNAAVISSSFLAPKSILFIAHDYKHKIPRLLRMNGVTAAGYYLGNFFFLFLYSCLSLIYLALFTVTYTFYFRQGPINYTKAEACVKALVYLCQVCSMVTLCQLYGSLTKGKTQYSRIDAYLNYFGIITTSVILNLALVGSVSFDHFKFFAFLPGFSGSWLVSTVHMLGNGATIPSLLTNRRMRFAFFGWAVQQLFMCSWCYYVVYLSTIETTNWYEPIVKILKRSKKTEVGLGVEERNYENDVLEVMDFVDRSFETPQEGNSLTNTHPLVLKHVRKQYRDGKLAVEDVTFAVGNNQIFGLLGPNGAGKSTLLHIIAGVHSASSGDLWIEGFNLSKDRSAYANRVSLCPQYDIYWEDLTCYQHLALFAILRGRPYDIDAITVTLERVQLAKYCNTPAKSLSGGERRRLSIAMALSGDARVILLDEPTTGLDPKVRRLVWQLIRDIRKDHLVVLTTHSMEEAEALSDKLTIMAHGTLRCFGTPEHLKNKFGGQTYISFIVNDPLPDPTGLIHQLETEYSLLKHLHTSKDKKNYRFRFLGSKQELLAFIRDVDGKKKEFNIQSFGIKQSNLDDVFMNIVKECDADA